MITRYLCARFLGMLALSVGFACWCEEESPANNIHVNIAVNNPIQQGASVAQDAMRIQQPFVNQAGGECKGAKGKGKGGQDKGQAAKGGKGGQDKGQAAKGGKGGAVQDLMQGGKGKGKGGGQQGLTLQMPLQQNGVQQPLSLNAFQRPVGNQTQQRMIPFCEKKK